MYHAKTLLTELNNEAATTRKFLALVPEDKYDWKPHPKSMSLKQLASHVAELPGWTHMALTTSELDFENNPYTYPTVGNTQDLLNFFDEQLQKGRTELEKATDNDLLPIWTLRSGANIYSAESKGEVIRMSLNQTTHHRAQLGVYLRLLDIAIPGSYGPSADEMEGFQF
ncbi:DinB family protein [Pseudoflavitalea rhizosphaerae]|uniref:DinB family protein n=1 Tax=Pseudoflavitalea rhizosphaerae TaxID=1884793 RepID=UPI000F8D6D7E|nr:DinB family protein [Pseudoflavitalea rhizosphaerae]